MRSERVERWTAEPERIMPRAPHAFPRVPSFPRCRDGELAASERGRPRALSDDQGGGALPQAESAWARTIWLPRVMRARWMYWAPAGPDPLIGQIP